MTPEEMTLLKTIVMTLADPRGNWQFGWETLCKMADMDPEKYRAHFAAHPIEPGGQTATDLSKPPKLTDDRL
jgi:hypothetical protein